MLLNKVLFNKKTAIIFIGIFSLLCTLNNCNEKKNITTIPINCLYIDSILQNNPQHILNLYNQYSNILFYERCITLSFGQALFYTGLQDSAIKFYQMLSKIVKDHDLNLNVQFQLSQIYYYTGKYLHAQHILDSLLNNNPSIDSSLLGWILLYQGKIERVLGNYINSQKFYLNAMNIATHRKDNKLLATILVALGKNSIIEGDKTLALRNYLKAYKIADSLNYALLLADVCNHIGGYYLLQQKHDLALEYHYKALKLRKKANVPFEIGQSYNNIGKTYSQLGKLDSAYYYYKLAMVIFKQTYYLKGLVKVYNNIGKLYHQQKFYDIAENYLKTANLLASKTNYNVGILESSLSLSKLYLSQQKTEQVFNILYNTPIHLTNDLDYLLEYYQILYRTHIIQKNYQQALMYHEKLLKCEKERLNVEKLYQQESLLISFELERKTKDNELLKKENALKEAKLDRNRLIIILFAIIMGFSIILSFIIYTRLQFNKKYNKELLQLNLQIVKQNKELDQLNNSLKKALQDKDKLFSIIAHELKNPLYWLQNLTHTLSKNYKNMNFLKMEKAIVSIHESAQQVYHLMENLLFWSRHQLNRVIPKFQQVDINGEIDLALSLFQSVIDSKYIEICKQYSTNFFIICDKDLMACILRNLISNAIKYTPNNGYIKINYSNNTHYHVIQVINSGSSFKASSFKKVLNSDIGSISMPGILNEKGSGLGLKLCKEFIAIHQGNIWIENSNKNETIISFSISKQLQISHLHTFCLHSVSKNNLA